MKKILLISVAYFLAIPVFATNKYVAKTGLDTNAGTFSQPFLTITKGLENRVAGDTLFVRNGNYAEYVNLSSSGTIANPIVLKNYGNEVVTVDGASSREHCIYALNRSNWVIEGINAKNSVNYNVVFASCSNIAYRNASSENPVTRIYNSGSQSVGVYVFGTQTAFSDHITIENVDCNGGLYGFLLGFNSTNTKIKNGSYNYASIDGIGMNWAEGIAPSDYRTHFSVEGAEVAYNMRQGIQTSGLVDAVFRNIDAHHNGATGIQIEDWSSNILIEGGSYHDNASEYLFETGLWIDDGENVVVRNIKSFNNSTGIRITYSKSVLIENSLIYGNNTGSADALGNTSGIDLSNSWAEVYNCTVARNSHPTSWKGGICVRDTGKFVLKNNIIALDASTADFRRTDTNMLVSDYNLFFNTRAINFSNMAQNYNLSQWQSLGFDANSLIADPLFIGPGDFHLQSNSPAIDHGANVGATTDYDGNLRVGIPDIGAYEYTAPSGAKKTVTTGNKAITINGKVIVQ